MISALIFTMFLSLVVCAVLVFELRRQSSIYESIFALLIADRDAARAEVIQVREALIPGLKHVQKPTQPATPVNVDKAIMSSRRPFRDKFKLLTQVHNTAQKARDALAAALPQKKEA
jgi:hypothetical protein